MELLTKLILFSKRQRFVTHILFWLMVGLFALGTSGYYHPDFSFADRLVNAGVPMIGQMIASYFLAYLILPGLLSGRNYLKVFLTFFVGAYLIAALSRIAIIYVAEPFIGEPSKKEETVIAILTDWWKLFYVYFFLSFSVAFVFIAFNLLKNYITIQQVRLALEKQKMETELKLLKTQLNPHFLFNTLNNIFSLAVIRSDDTPAAIARLSEILDYMLYRCSERYVPLSGEIKLLQNYIGLEQLRYGEQLQLSLRTDVRFPVCIAPLILLTVVENAFKHSASHNGTDPCIVIDLVAEKNSITFTCSNSFQPDNGENQDGHIGLKNLNDQLALLYSGAYELDTRKEDCIFTVHIHLRLNDNIPE